MSRLADAEMTLRGALNTLILVDTRDPEWRLARVDEGLGMYWAMLIAVPLCGIDEAKAHIARARRLARYAIRNGDTPGLSAHRVYDAVALELLLARLVVEDP